MKNVYYFKNQKRPWRFKKSVKGKVFQRNFATRRDAENFARSFCIERETKGAESMFFDREDKALLDQIRQICGDIHPLEAVKWWKEHWRPTMQDIITVRDAFNEFLKWLEESGRSRGHIRNVFSTAEKFCIEFGQRAPCSIRSDEILQWLLALSVSPKTKKNMRGDIASFFLWCRNAKGWVSTLPDVDARLLPKVERSRVDIWTVEQTEEAIRFIEREYPELIPHFALRLFAGLRESEARQMRWEWINFERKTILVPGFHDGARVCKTGDDWLILPSMLPNGAETVFAWLAEHREAHGALTAPGDTAGRTIRRKTKWKPNVARHTFATMLASWNLDDAKTILATRHTNVQTLHNHYKGVNQPREDVERYFALRPLAK